MNIEDFFLERYQQLEQENESLKQKLESMSNKEKYGVFAANEELKAVNITASSYYDVFERTYNPTKISKYSLEELKKLLGSEPSTYVDMNLINVYETMFIGEIKFIGVGESSTLHARMKHDRLETVYSLEDIKADKGCWPDFSDFLGRWCTEDCKDYLLSAARDELEEHIYRRIEKFESEEE